MPAVHLHPLHYRDLSLGLRAAPARTLRSERRLRSERAKNNQRALETLLPIHVTLARARRIQHREVLGHRSRSRGHYAGQQTTSNRRYEDEPPQISPRVETPRPCDECRERVKITAAMRRAPILQLTLGLALSERCCATTRKFLRPQQGNTKRGHFAATANSVIGAIRDRFLVAPFCTRYR